MTATSSSRNKNILIVTGEASGDLHGSNLIRAAKVAFPELSFYGVGGKKMKQAGCDLLFSSDDLAVMGLFEIFSHLPTILRRFNFLKRIIVGSNPPDVLVLIDFPDFNLRLAKIAKKSGIKVLYYITPKVWAWRKKRAKTIADNCDHLALIFPFEPEIFIPHGVAADYVGNPLLDEFKQNVPKGTLRNKLGIDSAQQVVGIFPGSRNSEVKYILDTLIETAKLIYAEKPDIKFLLPVAPSLDEATLRNRFAAESLPIFLLNENIYEVSCACNAVLCVSGTVTLQITLTNTPMAILYKISPLSYAIGKHLIKIPFVGLTNIIAGEGVVREFIQDAAEPKGLKDEVVRLLDDPRYVSDMREKLSNVRGLLGHPGCSERVACIVKALAG